MLHQKTYCAHTMQQTLIYLNILFSQHCTLVGSIFLKRTMKMTVSQHFIYRKIYLKNIYQRNINVLLLIQISNSCPFTTRNWIVLLPITKQLLPSPLYFTYYKQCSPRITIRIILQGNIKIRTRKMSVQNRHTV